MRDKKIRKTNPKMRVKTEKIVKTATALYSLMVVTAFKVITINNILFYTLLYNGLLIIYSETL